MPCCVRMNPMHFRLTVCSAACVQSFWECDTQFTRKYIVRGRKYGIKLWILKWWVMCYIRHPRTDQYNNIILNILTLFFKQCRHETVHISPPTLSLYYYSLFFSNIHNRRNMSILVMSLSIHCVWVSNAHNTWWFDVAFAILIRIFISLIDDGLSRFDADNAGFE